MAHDMEQQMLTFARTQAKQHMINAELSFSEQKRGASSRVNAQQMQEATDDLMVYMSDYMEDLITQGYSEPDAFAAACAALEADSQSAESIALQERYIKYIDKRSEDAMGLLIGGYACIGIVVGAIVGLALGMWVFPGRMVLSIILSLLAGCMLGAGAAMVQHALRQ